MKEYLCLRVPLRREMMTTVRLATGGVCSAAAMSYDGGEDCKVCVTESLLLLMRRGYSAASVCFSAREEGGGVRVCVTGSEGSCGQAASDEDEIALALLNALAEDVTMDRDGGALKAIAFAFGQQA